MGINPYHLLSCAPFTLLLGPTGLLPTPSLGSMSMTTKSLTCAWLVGDVSTFTSATTITSLAYGFVSTTIFFNVSFVHNISKSCIMKWVIWSWSREWPNKFYMWWVIYISWSRDHCLIVLNITNWSWVILNPAPLQSCNHLRSWCTLPPLKGT